MSVPASTTLDLSNTSGHVDQKTGLPCPLGIATEYHVTPCRIVTPEQKHAYAAGNHLPMVFFGVASAVLLLIGLCRFATIELLLCVAVPFVLMNGTYLLLSYSVMLAGSRFRLADHQHLLQRWQALESGLSQVQVDVFLPVCGERIDTVLEAWAGVKLLRWPGPVNVWVLDDSPTDHLRSRAAEFGFHYLRREGRELRKAGNLRYAFARTSAEFILLLDADFRPSPEILHELLPYLLEDDRVGLVQSPQFFDVHPRMNWVEAGAGFVQELFYRVIQPARDRFEAAVCVGSCAVYRRAALDALQGCPPIDHSEDLWTGFELQHRGWKLRYVPIVLAKGLCPDRLETFFSQQYRWCRGSLSLVLSRRFWTSRLSWGQKTCYAAGFVYYFATAFNGLLAPLPPLLMAALFPDWVHGSHLLFSLLAVIYTLLILNWWSIYPFGVHFLTSREVSGAAHLQALADTLIARPQDWIVSGGEASAQSPCRRRTACWAFALTLISVTACTALIWAGAVLAISREPQRYLHFVPLLGFSTFQLVVCWRALADHQRRLTWGRLCCLPGLAIACLSAAVLFLPAAQRPFDWLQRAAALAISKAEHLPAHALGAAFSTAADADFATYTVEDAFPGLPVRRVIRLRSHPLDPQVSFLADFTGLIYEVRRVNQAWTSRVVADLTESDLSFLYSFEVHPHFPRDRRFFLAYRTGTPADSQSLRISSLTIPETGAAGLDDESVLIEQAVESDEHLGGDLAFDDQSCLLISCGDNERSLHDRRSQRLDLAFSSGILRIDVDSRGGAFSFPPRRRPEQAVTAGYFIPRDNPFVNVPGALEEFWALGLRNPFRMSFDLPAQQLWIGDVGQDRMEQIEVARSGTNHQWSFREGTLPFEQSHLRGQAPEPVSGVSTDPVYEYPHRDLDHCIVGGMISRGHAFPELHGRYLFGDNRSGRIWALDPQHPGQRTELLQLPFGKSASSLVSLSSDAAGDIYFTNFVSVPAVYRLARSAPMDFPETLSQTGLFTSLSPLRPAADLVSYEVTVPLWSDGLQKSRWVRLPPGKRISTETPDWKFPAGTLFVKHFAQSDDFLQPGAPVETRVLVVRTDGTTAGASYLWNDSGTEASLQTSRAQVRLSATTGEFEYQVPAPADCKVCHQRDRSVLGFQPHQLHRTVSTSGADRSQLERLTALQLFTSPLSSAQTASIEPLNALDRPDASLEARVRSYLSANCSFCHREEGLEHVSLNLQLAGPNLATLINQPAKLGYHRIDGEFAKQLIAPGDPENSALYRRLRTTDRRYSMPYLGRSRPDSAALDLLRDWILSLGAAEPHHSDPQQANLP